MEELGEPWENEGESEVSQSGRQGPTIEMEMASGDDGGSFSSPMPCRFMWTLRERGSLFNTPLAPHVAHLREAMDFLLRLENALFTFFLTPL